jgi:hypothetical protein
MHLKGKYCKEYMAQYRRKGTGALDGKKNGSYKDLNKYRG